MSTDEYVPDDEDWVPTEEEVRPELLLSDGDRPDIEHPGRRRYVTRWEDA